VFDEDGQFIKASEIVRGASATRIVGAVDGAQPKARTHVRGAAIYGGFAFRHFGHLLVESLNRVWMSSLPAGRTPIYVQTLGKELSPVAAQLFELAGIRSLVRVVRHDTSFDSVILPESAFVHRVQAHTVFKQLYMRMTDRALGRKRPSVTQQPLYLSRTGLSELQRTTAGEAVLEEALASSGFRIVHPERLALEEQIRLVNEHQVIVGSIGSAFHLLLFSRLENEAVYFSCGLPGLSFALCDALNGTRAHYLLTAHRDPPPKEPWVKAWNYPDWLDVNATLAALHDLGMIPKMTVDDAKLGPIEDEYRRRLAAKLRADEKRGEQREG
jgi:capsular polysaccharide biosynthesis protein